jgi:hypothetical protein
MGKLFCRAVFLPPLLRVARLRGMPRETEIQCGVNTSVAYQSTSYFVVLTSFRLFVVCTRQQCH